MRRIFRLLEFFFWKKLVFQNDPTYYKSKAFMNRLTGKISFIFHCLICKRCKIYYPKKKFQNIYGKKVWEALQTGSLPKVTWGPTAGWKERIEKGPNLPGGIAPAGNIMKETTNEL